MRFLCLAVILLNSASLAEAKTHTYQMTFTTVDGSSTLGEIDFFTAMGITPVDEVVVRFTFDDKQSYTFPENYSGDEYQYEEAWTPWSELSLSFGVNTFYAFPTDSNPYTSIRVRDGISDGTGDISDRVLLDAEFDYVSPLGYSFSQLLVSLYDFDEGTFSGTKVPAPDVLNSLADSNPPLTIYSNQLGTRGPRLTASSFFVEDVTPLPGCDPSGNRPNKCQLVAGNEVPLIVSPLPPANVLFIGALALFGGLSFLRRKRLHQS